MKFAKFALAGAAAAGIAFAALTSVPSLAEMTVTVGGAPMFPSKNIIQNAVNSKDHTTLVAAVKAADLVDTLSGKGPFTVFAPTDAAFAALPAGTLEGLLKDPAALKKILLYHVVSGAVTSDKVVGLTSANSVEGSPIAIAVKDGTVYLNDSAKVVTADVTASNGVIHVIDTVLLPPAS